MQRVGIDVNYNCLPISTFTAVKCADGNVCLLNSKCELMVAESATVGSKDINGNCLPHNTA